MDRVFTREEILDLYTNDDKRIGKGAFGDVKEVSFLTLIKTYPADTRDVSTILIPARFDVLKREENDKKIKFPNNLTREERILRAKKRLLYTETARDLIKGLAYYHDYAFGTLLTYYRRFVDLTEASKYLSDEEKIEVCHNLEMLLNDFHKNYIYPMDIKGSNIMVNPNTLETKMIDLEDKCVYYMDSVDENKRANSKVRMESMEKRLGLKN